MVTFSLLARPLSNLFLLSILLLITTKTSALILYDDGSSHSITESINDAVNLRSGSTLLFSGEDYSIRAPQGSESAVRLYMSSTLNMTSGEIIGGDLEGGNTAPVEKDTLIGVGVIVGSASVADFHSGATVRGGSHVGELVTLVDGQVSKEVQSGKGGDALVGLYFSSTITIHGGNFIGGRGILNYGHSLHVAYEAVANVYGGSFQGSFLARDRGVIIVHGCLSRVGNRLVGHLDSGDSIDVELVEENGGQVVVQIPKFAQTCERYRRRSSGQQLGVGVVLAFNLLWAVAGPFTLYL
jgi:hypothetical protein